MSSLYLSDDCIYYVIRYLRDDNSSLFNCLLVNRFWCKETVPLLYANPFEHLLNSKNINATHKYSIITTLTSCFDKAEILQFKNQLNLYEIKINNNFINEPLFEYARYLENYNCLTINNIIIGWFNKIFDVPNNHEIITEFTPTFHQSNLRQGINIRQLDILLHSLYSQDNNIRSSAQNLSRLNSLVVGGIDDKYDDVAQDFFEGIAKSNCTNLGRLKISLYNNISMKIKENLCTTIRKQNNFHALKITRCKALLNDIFLSLEFQKHSLVYIEFERIIFDHISFRHFITLYNLKYVRFIWCGGICSDQLNLFSYASFKLKELTIFTRENNIILSMIKYLGNTLQKLSFDGVSITEIMIEYISTYCTKLDSLKIRIGLSIHHVFPYFKNLKISKLILIRGRTRNSLLADIFKHLVPMNVKEISICFIYPNYFNDVALKEILDNCHHQLETINLNINLDFKQLKIILNYIEKNNNNLKFLGTKMLERVLKYEEMKLLDRIKGKGVKLVDFYNIHREFSPIVYDSFN